jgi:hypothetical protein
MQNGMPVDADGRRATAGVSGATNETVGRRLAMLGLVAAVATV